MALECVSIAREATMGQGAGGEYYLGDTLGLLDGLTEKYAGQVKCIYLDPPFLTGQSFSMSVRAGEKDWRTMTGSIKAPTFEDHNNPDEYYGTMRLVIEASLKMLRDDGAMFVHVDYRAHARLRLIADEIFGEENFVNEIIWAYKSGGRARSCFPRKHDIILLYRKSKKLDFDIKAVLEKRAAPPENHMRRHVDPDGRVYRSIRSGGRIYTYYDDDPVAPTDVWDDVSHLQQKDYERTGYDTQKPLKLLHRIERCVTRENDIVMDLFAGACTALEAARIDGRRFVGADRCQLTVNIARRRLADCPVEYHLKPSPPDGAVCEAGVVNGVGLYHVTLEKFQLDQPALGLNGFEAIDNWAAGYIENGVFRAAAHFERTQRQPRLKTELRVPVYDGQPAIRIGDISGESRYFLLNAPDSI
jgi:DNA modification methylase